MVCCIVYVYPERNPVAIYLAKLGGEKCKSLYTLKRPVGAVEELLSLDLGFGHIAPQYQDIEIQYDEEDPVDFGPAILGGEGGEDYFAVNNEAMDIPDVIPVHEAVMEDIIVGKIYNGNPFQGDQPAYHF